MFRQHLITVFGLSVFVWAHAVFAAKPNVLIIYTDDQGSLDMGVYGAPDLMTPTMDSLAKSGIRFTQFYSNSPICSASRAALLTGKTPLKAGLVSNAGHLSKGLPSSNFTLAEAFKEQGYRCAHIGKWHLGKPEGLRPLDQGFDFSFGHMGGCIDNYSHFFYWSGPNHHDLWLNEKEVYRPGEYFPEMMVEEAGKFIAQESEKPYFMYFAINMPHYPYQGYPKWLEHYKHIKDEKRRLYAAFLSTMDEIIGQLLEVVDRENTIIVLQSDQGHCTSARAYFGGGYAGPYRGAKQSLFEGGIRIPALISWPGKLPQNEVRSQMVMACDWYPTLLGLCGLPCPDDLEGENISTVLQSAEAPSPHTMINWVFLESSAIRKGKWKLIVNPVDTSGRNWKRMKGAYLYDLDSDVSEQKNLASGNPSVVNELRALHKEWKTEAMATQVHD